MASSGSDHAVREQSRSPVPCCRARATVSRAPPCTNYYASPPWYIAPLQQLGGTDSVAAANARALASAARAEELQARWATPPPYAPEPRRTPRALRPAPAEPDTRLCPGRSRPFGSINGCCWRWTDTWSRLNTSSPWRPRDGSTRLPRCPTAKCCPNFFPRALTLQHHHHRPPMASYRNDALVQDKERAVEQLAEARADEAVSLHSEVQATSAKATKVRFSFGLSCFVKVLV